MFIKAIKTANVKGYLKLLVDTGEGHVWFLLSESQYDALGRPAPCDEISDEDFRVITSGDEYNRAKKKALNILAFGDNSVRELIQKLSRAGISRAVSCAVTEEMIKLGYIDEERQLMRLVENEANVKLSGSKKIFAQLAKKGYAPEKIKSTIRRLEIEGIINFEENKKKLLAGIADEEERRKILYKKGF